MIQTVRSLTIGLLLAAAMFSPVHAGPEVSDAAAAKASFEKADKALNAAWAAVKDALNEDELAALKRDQKAWLAYRESMARSPVRLGVIQQEELSITSTEYLEAATSYTKDRTEWLKALVRKWPETENLTGEWADGYGGYIMIVEQKGKLAFHIECVRGPTGHLGELNGAAQWNESIGWFSVKPPGHSGEETSLSFIFRDRQLEIIGVNTSHFHGARAYFDGKYVKVRSLNRKEREVVLSGRMDQTGR